jgi:hypothetical protein
MLNNQKNLAKAYKKVQVEKENDQAKNHKEKGSFSGDVLGYGQSCSHLQVLFCGPYCWLSSKLYRIFFICFSNVEILGLNAFILSTLD